MGVRIPRALFFEEAIDGLFEPDGYRSGAASREMSWLKVLQAASSLASIATAAIAAWAYSRYVWNRRQKRLRLENHLKTIKETAREMEPRHRTPLQLMVALGMTEAEIVDISFRSNCIKRIAGTVYSGQDPVMALEYSPKNSD